MVWAIAILCLVLYAPLAEYAAHRWLMHYPGLGRGSWWREHAVEHHGKSRNDVNIDLNALSVVASVSPLLVFAIFLGWAWVAFVLLACIGYAALWSSLHEAYHGVSENWVTKFRFYDIWLNHHLKHHKQPTRNFGTVFIFTDRLFRTLCLTRADLRTSGVSVKCASKNRSMTARAIRGYFSGCPKVP